MFITSDRNKKKPSSASRLVLRRERAACFALLLDHG